VGHIRLGVLPHSRSWREVVSLLENDADTPQVAAASLAASQRGLIEAARDKGLINSFWLLAQIASASQSTNFLGKLHDLGLDVTHNSSFLDITTAFTKYLDSSKPGEQRTDVGEMGQMAATETITALVGHEAESLFGSTSADVQRAFKSYSTTKQFGALMREFTSRFTQRYLAYFLSRELSNHVGSNSRFANIKEHTEFAKALNLHCYEASAIIETFSGGWFSKTKFVEKDISHDKAAEYVYVALKKLRSELKKRGEADE